MDDVIITLNATNILTIWLIALLGLVLMLLLAQAFGQARISGGAGPGLSNIQN